MNPSEKLWYLKNCELLAGLTAEQLSSLESKCRIRQFPAKSTVYLPGDAADSLLLVAKGLVKVCHLTPDGKQSTLAFIEPGEVFGELSLFDSGQRDEFVETVTDSQIIRIPNDEMQSLMSRDLNVSMGVNRLMGLRRQRVERRLKNLLFLSNHDRLAHLLIDLADQFGEETPEGIRINMKLSHQELANLIGSTRETVTLMLGKLKSAGLIAGQRQSIVICSMDQLSKSIMRTN